MYHQYILAKFSVYKKKLACYLHALHSLFFMWWFNKKLQFIYSSLGRCSVNIVLYVPQCLFKLELSHCVLRQTLKSKTLCTASSILLLNCIANQVTCLPYINHTVLTRGIEKNRIVSSEMVEHLCFKSVKQSGVFLFSFVCTIDKSQRIFNWIIQ